MIRITSILITAIVAVYIPFAAVEPLARVLVPGIALMGAGIFPSMSLVVGAMKGDERTPKIVKELHEKLKNILKVLVAAFVLILVSILLLLASVGLEYTKNVPHVDLIRRIVICLAAVSVALLADRVSAVVRTFFAVLELNKKQALLVARAGNQKLFTDVRNSASLSSDDYGDKPKQLKSA